MVTKLKLTESTVMYIQLSKILTLQSVVLWVRRKGPVGEKLSKADARILWLVHHIVPHSLHQPVHKLQTGRAQNLNDFIPLVDVWTAWLLWKNPDALWVCPYLSKCKEHVKMYENEKYMELIHVYSVQEQVFGMIWFSALMIMKCRAEQFINMLLKLQN